MRNRVAFFVITSIATLVVFLLAVYGVLTGLTNARINQLIQEVTTRKSQATQAAELASNTESGLRATNAFQEVSFTPTVQSLNADIDRISQTATSTAYEGTAMAEKFKQLSATATSVAPLSIEVKYQETETVSLFGDKLSIEFAGYGFWSSVVKIIVQSPNSVSQTFYMDPGEVVLYKNYKNYIILRGDSGEKKDEQGVIIVQFVVTGY